MATAPDVPTQQDVDVHGLTHPGKVRKDNQDHFFIGSVPAGIPSERTSVPGDLDGVVLPETFVSLAMVADGVGSGGGGEEAARTAVEAVTKFVLENAQHAYAAPQKDPDGFTVLLYEAALACHEQLLERAEHDPEHMRYATTLTLWLGLWPHGYLLQVGDSRCYLFREGKLTQISRDQTMAQELVDQGVLTQTRAHATRWAHVLSSAIGGQQAAPSVTRVERSWGSILLLCSDGLTKHVSDEEIAGILGNLQSSRQACEELLQVALDDGGTDNITMIIGRTVPRT
jgi:protein phosphatase